MSFRESAWMTPSCSYYPKSRYIMSSSGIAIGKKYIWLCNFVCLIYSRKSRFMISYCRITHSCKLNNNIRWCTTIFQHTTLDIAEGLQHTDIHCGICHHPEDMGCFPMFGKSNVDDSSLGTNRTPILTKEFCKHIHSPFSWNTLQTSISD